MRVMSLRGLDHAIYLRLTETKSPTLDRAVRLLTRAADRSALWLVTALALAAGGGKKGRKAALRGVTAIGLASLLANTILKMAWRRSRPAETGVTVVRRPKSFSFPSGHTASAFAFATAVGLEMPILAAPLALAAAAVGYSRIRGRVHYPSDVLVGAAVGIAAGLASQPVSRAVTMIQDSLKARSLQAAAQSRRVVLVVSPHAGRVAREIDRARRALVASGAEVVEELTVEAVEQVPDAVRRHDASVVIAAGGDGTVGAVADQLANSGTALLVMPLGTSNDFARSLQIPMNLEAAAALLSRGKISIIDLGRVDVPGQRSRHFVHAATVGLNVSFAKLATRASFRRRLGRLTYMVAAAIAVRERRAFNCRLTSHGQTETLPLAQLSVINAPVFGGVLGLRVRGSDPNDLQLDVLAVEDLPSLRTILAGVYQLIRLKRPLEGVHASHTSELLVQADEQLEVALDGEIAGKLPCRFVAAGQALRVVTPRVFGDIGAA
jgi:YegS/Rv2252/BmrU family lipid kinase